MGYKQISKMIGSTDDSSNATPDEVTTVIADKTHLANLITTLKSEMASANALLKSKETDYNEAKLQVNRFKDDLSDANKRIVVLENQCEQYRQTVSVSINFIILNSSTFPFPFPFPCACRMENYRTIFF